MHVAAAVGGRILELPVAENVRVAKGDLLFQIDPLPFQLSVAQAEAELHFAEAQLDTQRRVVATNSAAVIAGDETKNAEENRDLAERTAARLRPLAAKGYVPKQQLDQAESPSAILRRRFSRRRNGTRQRLPPSTPCPALRPP